MIFFIYILRHPDTRKVVYVGCTSNLKHRFACHKCIYSWKHKYEPIMKIVEQHKCDKKAKLREWKLIQFYNSISPLNQKADKMNAGGIPHAIARERRRSKKLAA